MTTRERRAEYSSSNVVRVLSPTRPLSPNPPEYDNNLEYLLDDLQHSISRPGSSLGQNQAYTRTERDVQYLSPSNTSTIIRERSRSPNSEAQRVYKTATYEYSTSGQRPGSNDMMQQNIHQLDTLLSDLNNERDSSLDRNRLNNGTLSSSSNLGIDSGLLEPIPTGGGTTKIIKQTTYTTDYGTGKPQVQRELIFDSPDIISKSSTLDSRSSRTRQRSPEQKYYKTIEKTVTRRDGSYPPDVDTGLYGGLNRRPLSPPQNDKYSSNTLKTYNYSTNTKEETIVPPNVPYNEIVHVETTQGDIPLPLKEVQLSDDILPKPATKVTTTVRTYTYEIPADPQPPTNRTVVYKNESYDTNTTTQGIPPHQPQPQHPRQPVNQTIIYKNESHTTNTNLDYPGNQPPYGSIQPIQPVQSAPQHPPGHPPGVNKTIIYKKDTRETTTNVYPGNKKPYPPPSNQNQPIVEFPPEQNQPNYRPQSPPVNNTTVIYRENITDTKNTHHHHPPAGGVPVYPSGNPPPSGVPAYPSGNTPPQQGPKTTYYYKHESSNTTNTHYGPNGPNGPNQPPNNVSPYPNDKYPKPTVLYPSNGYPPNHSPHQPNDPTIIYNYSTTTRTNNTNHGYPHEKEPLLQPTPFPTDGLGPDVNDGTYPPKRLDDLMATFGDTSKNNNYNNGPPYPGERPLVQNNLQTALVPSKPTASVDPKPSARNIQGPAVYYPPGHELFAQNAQGSGGGGGGGGEMMQSSSAYRSQGGYAKGSGKYMYESESRSKSKSSSGAAVVPVCLPLCCAMPCVLM